MSKVEGINPSSEQSVILSQSTCDQAYIDLLQLVVATNGANARNTSDDGMTQEQHDLLVRREQARSLIGEHAERGIFPSQDLDFDRYAHPLGKDTTEEDR
jgi:hypothetical protein